MKESESRSPQVKFFSGQEIPLELHKVRIVQKLHLRPIERRKQAMEEAGFNTFLLETKDVFLDMLTDSGTNAMSDKQLGSMMVADDAYAGSASFTRMQEAVRDVFGMHHVLPVHQGRAAENIISKIFVKPGDVVPMNYHFTTTKAHIEINGGQVLEIYTDEALKIKSDCPFKGNLDLDQVRGGDREVRRGEDPLRPHGGLHQPDRRPAVLDAEPARSQCHGRKHGIMVVLDVSLVGENAYFIKQREPGYETASIRDILIEMCGLSDLIYFSSRKVSCTRGGGIATNRLDHLQQDEGLGAALRGLPHLRRHVGARNRGHGRRPARNHRRRRWSANRRISSTIWSTTSTPPACRW